MDAMILDYFWVTAFLQLGPFQTNAANSGLLLCPHDHTLHHESLVFVISGIKYIETLLMENLKRKKELASDDGELSPKCTFH